MAAVHRRELAARTLRKTLRSQAGAFDLTSILVGVVVVIILVLGVFAVVFGAIPWVQDNAAKQDLENVRTAEGVAMARMDGFKDKAGLVTGNLLTDATTLSVRTNADADCYVGLSKSATGRVFYNTDKLSKPARLTPAIDPGCIDSTSRDQLLDEVGGYSPNSDDKDGDGVPNAEDPTPDGAGGGGGATDTDGDGTPDSEDPTPNGEADPNALPAGYTWSDRVVYKNSIKDPSFQLGMTGWTLPRPSSSAKTLTHDPAMGMDGGAAVKMVTSGTTTGSQFNYAYFRLPEKSPAYEYAVVHVRSGMAAEESVYVSVVTQAADGTFIAEGPITSAIVGGTQSGWKKLSTNVPGQAWQNPAGSERYLKVRVGGNYNQAFLENSEFFIDRLSLGESQDYFDGNTASAGEFSYAWAGEQHDSVSEKSTTKQIATPSVITLGQDFTVTGRGFPANTEVTVREYEEYYGAVTATTDGSGNFTATMNIPVEAPTGPGQLEVFSGWGVQKIWKNVTFE